MYTKRLIEETFPVKEVSEHSAYEKNVRHGHISTLHIYWARRPLAASRASSYAALINADRSTPEEKAFIVDLANWDNIDNDIILSKARKRILEDYGSAKPIVLDPFGGGGAIPLELMRLGCKVFSNDLNPISVIIQKCTLEYPQKVKTHILFKDIDRWGKWIYGKANERLSNFYSSNEESISTFFWAHSIKCTNPSCKVHIPLLRTYWLYEKPSNSVALHPIIKNGLLHFELIETSQKRIPDNFDPSKGSISNAVATCPACGTNIKSEEIRKLFFEKKSTQNLLAIAFVNQKNRKGFRIANSEDIKRYESTISALEKLNNEYTTKYGINLIPDEIISTPTLAEYQPGGSYYNFTPIVLYGFTKWGDLFNPRQKLVLGTFTVLLQEAFELMYEENADREYSKIITTYLALVVSKLTSTNNLICRYNNGSIAGKPDQFGALEMKYDYPESNSLSSGSGGFIGHLKSVLNVKVNSTFKNPDIQVTNQNAAELSFNDNFFDAVFTDPPYYDNIPYSNISDFFYVWLKRSIGHLYPEFFLSPIILKKDEIIADITLIRGIDKKSAPDLLRHLKTKDKFEFMLNNSFKEIYRVLKPNGIAIIVYAHKSTEGWESIINALTNSNLVITAAWPIDTERKSRQRAQESAALASSIYIVCRKIERQPTAFYNDVKEETKNYLGKKLDRLWNEGISGADFFIAAIGSSIEVFGKYQSVIDYEGNVIRANKLLEDVRIIVTDYAVKKILHNGFATGISELTRFYVLCRWEFKAAKIPFDEANKLSHSCHIELASLWQSKSFVKKDKEFIQILGPQDRDVEDIEDSGELIDVLHYAIKLWEKGNKAEMQKVLNESGYAKSDAFFRVAQAIAETLPNESKEKKLLEGFLNLRERISDGFKVKEDDQGDFFKN